MKTPETFEGVLYPMANSNISEYDNLKYNIYSRKTDTKSLKEFLNSIKNENLAWDEPTKNLYYRDKTGELYRLQFVKVHET